MDPIVAEQLMQSSDSFVEANAVLEAARITAQATIDAARIMFWSGVAAAAGGFFIIIAAFVQAGPQYRERWQLKQSYRLYMDTVARSALARTIGPLDFAQLKVSAQQATRTVALKPYANDLPEALEHKHWKDQGILGAEFMKLVEAYREQHHTLTNWCKENDAARTTDLVVDLRGTPEQTQNLGDEGVTFIFPQTSAAEAYLAEVKLLSDAATKLLIYLR